MNKHTPAPWKVKENGQTLTPSIVTADDFTITREIARIKDVPNGAYKHNARLIAAAPELLDALKEAWAIIDGMRKPGINLYVKEETVNQIESAILKAEGDTP